MMDGYALFAWPDYEALGGLNDMVCCGTIEFCRERMNQGGYLQGCNEAQIVLLANAEVIESFQRNGREWVKCQQA